MYMQYEEFFFLLFFFSVDRCLVNSNIVLNSFSGEICMIICQINRQFVNGDYHRIISLTISIPYFMMQRCVCTMEMVRL
jgi:hypothetical protein